MMAIFSTAYLPPIQYIELLLRSKTVTLEKHETYTKQTYRNRCLIYSANGVLALTIPVVKPNGNRTLTKDIRIDNSVKWRKEHWRSIESAYQSSAYFEFIIDYFLPYYNKEWDFLWDYNLSIIHTILDILDNKVDIGETNVFEKQITGQNDYRFIINPKINSNMIDISLVQNKYFQVFALKHGFIPNLSILDLLCNCGMESKIYLAEK
jgi:hypothetical protein